MNDSSCLVSINQSTIDFISNYFRFKNLYLKMLSNNRDFILNLNN